MEGSNAPIHGGKASRKEGDVVREEAARGIITSFKPEVLLAFFFEWPTNFWERRGPRDEGTLRT